MANDTPPLPPPAPPRAAGPAQASLPARSEPATRAVPPAPPLPTRPRCGSLRAATRSALLEVGGLTLVLAALLGLPSLLTGDPAAADPRAASRPASRGTGPGVDVDVGVGVGVGVGGDGGGVDVDGGGGGERIGIAAGLPDARTAPGPLDDGMIIASETWRWPVAAPHRVVRGFERPRDRYSAGHRGIDIAAPAGTPVSAVADGVITFSGVVVDRSLVVERTEAGTLVDYEPVSPSVEAGEAVARGDTIGMIESEAHCAGGCLHVGARRNGDYVDPLLFLGGVPRAVLLPWDG